MKRTLKGVDRVAVCLIVGLLFGQQIAVAQSKKPEIVHDSEYYILEAQHGQVWAAEDKDLDTKLAELRKKYGTPPNIIHIMWDDMAVGEVGLPAIQKVRGFETPNINRLAAEGINFMRMYTEPSCTPSRAAVLTGRQPVRNGMYNVGFPYEYGGLAADEVTLAEVLSKAGYATAFYGKAHIGDVEVSYLTKHGFDEALWTPYNQVPSLFTPQGQMAVLTPAVMYPQMFGKDWQCGAPAVTRSSYALEGPAPSMRRAEIDSSMDHRPVCFGRAGNAVFRILVQHD